MIRTKHFGYMSSMDVGDGKPSSFIFIVAGSEKKLYKAHTDWASKLLNNIILRLRGLMPVRSFCDLTR